MKAAPPNSTTVTPMNTGQVMPVRSSMAMSSRPRSMPALEIGRAHLRIAQQLGAGPGQRDLAVDHDVAAMGELERVVGVLLDQEYRDLLLLVDVADDLEDLLDDERRQPERRLVEQQQPWPAHQRPRDREHL